MPSDHADPHQHHYCLRLPAAAPGARPAPLVRVTRAPGTGPRTCRLLAEAALEFCVEHDALRRDGSEMLVVPSSPRRGHDRVVTRRRRSTTVPGDDAGLP